MAAELKVQPIRDGVDVVHLNLYWSLITPRRGARLPGADELKTNLNRFLKASPASVSIDPSVKWKGDSTLVFRADVPMPMFVYLPSITLPGVVLPVPVPDKLRHLKMPHTDVVGTVGSTAHGFTVETLTRGSDDKDDRLIRSTVRMAALQAAPLLGAGVVAEPLLERYLVDVNRHHFLAGRRSFYISEVEGGNWLFQTAAVERFSMKEFKVGAETAYGSPENAVNQIWQPMVREVASFYGQLVKWNSWNARCGSVADVASFAPYKQISGFMLLP